MPTYGWLLIGTLVAAVGAGLVEWRLLGGYRRLRGSLLRRLRPELRRRFWVVCLPGSLLLAGGCAFVPIAHGVLGPSEFPVHLLGVVFLLSAIADSLAVRYLGLYPFPGFRGRYISDRIPSARLRIVLLSRLPSVALLWITALVWFRS